MNEKIHDSMNMQEKVKDSGLDKAVKERKAVKESKLTLRGEFEVSR